MRAFRLEPGMKNMTGVFYPTGWMVLMFPTEQDAREAGRKLAADGLQDEHMMLMTPADFAREVGAKTGDEAILPSAGTEGDTIRKMALLSGQGHHGLLVHAPDHKQSDRVMQALRGCPISFGQKYRKLVIEDVVD
jgi:hypothetical protein